VQLAFGSNEEGQLLLAAKSPVAVIVPNTRFCEGEGFLIVEVCGALVVPTAWLAKVSFVGDNEIDWPAPCSTDTYGL
jgi:hypothetical protein